MPGKATGVPLMVIRRGQVALEQAVQDGITGVTVALSMGEQASFSLELNDPAFKLIDRQSGVLSEGQTLEIALRSGGMELVEVISGTVSAINVELDEEDGLRVEVEGYDALRSAAAGDCHVQYQDSWSDFHVLQSLAELLKLELSIDSASRQAMSAAPVRARLQDGLSNLAFIGVLAEEYGCDFWVLRRTLHFRRETPGNKIKLRRGVNLLRIAVRLSTSGQVAGVAAQAWDTGSAQAMVAQANGEERKAYWGHLSAQARTLLRSEAQVRHLRGRDLAEAERRSEAEMRRLARQLIMAEGSTPGNPELRVGSVVELSNMGRFDGEYLAQSVRHSIGKDGFRTDFTLCLHV